MCTCVRVREKKTFYGCVLIWPGKFTRRSRILSESAPTQSIPTCRSWSLFPGVGRCSPRCPPRPRPLPPPPPPPLPRHEPPVPAGAPEPHREVPCSSRGVSADESAGSPTTARRWSSCTPAGWGSGDRSSPSLPLLLPDRRDSPPDQQTFCFRCTGSNRRCRWPPARYEPPRWGLRPLDSSCRCRWLTVRLRSCRPLSFRRSSHLAAGSEAEGPRGGRTTSIGSWGSASHRTPSARKSPSRCSTSHGSARGNGGARGSCRSSVQTAQWRVSAPLLDRTASNRDWREGAEHSGVYGGRGGGRDDGERVREGEKEREKGVGGTERERERDDGERVREGERERQKGGMTERERVRKREWNIENKVKMERRERKEEIESGLSETEDRERKRGWERIKWRGKEGREDRDVMRERERERERDVSSSFSTWDFSCTN